MKSEPRPPSDSPPVPTGWTPLSDGHLPAPTFWPAGLALGITFIFWSLITSWVVLVVGLATFAASLTGWIRDILDEQRESHS